MNPNKNILSLPIFDKIFGLVPDDPKLQSQYMYYLTWIIFLGLLGYSAITWLSFVNTLELSYLFRGLFMSAICLLSFFGLKQTRTTYIAIKTLTLNPKKFEVESVEEMLKHDETISRP